MSYTNAEIELVPVNGGKIEAFRNMWVEVLGPNISGHTENMAVSYASEGNVKVEMVVCKATNTVTLYRFRKHSDLHHYWSRNYTFEKISSMDKYKNMFAMTLSAYEYFFEHKG